MHGKLLILETLRKSWVNPGEGEMLAMQAIAGLYHRAHQGVVNSLAEGLACDRQTAREVVSFAIRKAKTIAIEQAELEPFYEDAGRVLRQLDSEARVLMVEAVARVLMVEAVARELVAEMDACIKQRRMTDLARRTESCLLFWSHLEVMAAVDSAFVVVRSTLERQAGSIIHA